MTIQKEIKEALERAHVPYSIDEDNGDLLGADGRTIADFWYHEEDVHLVVSAPTWLLHQQELIEKLQKELELTKFGTSNLEHNRRLLSEEIVQKDVEIEQIHNMLTEQIENKKASFKHSQQQAEDIRKLREALEWYADEKNWQLGVTITMGSAHPYHEPIKSDKGERACHVLSQLTPIKGESNE
jgi:hypothetical protein